MKVIIVFILACFSSAVFAQNPKHYVFLIHGIGASPSTFGAMREALAEEAKSLDPQTDWQMINFSYETGSATKDVMIFSHELSDFIAAKFTEAGGLQPEDKFSLVMHSQGGLVGLNFLLRSFQGDIQYHPELQDHLDAFITMGTPYWGAKIAIFANRMMPILSYLRIPLSEKFGSEELKDMELASDFTAYMREIFMSEENRDLLKRLKARGRFLVISGVTERLNFLAPFVSGKNRYEDDTTVPIPSARMDFMYYADSADKHKDTVGIEDFRETGMVEQDNYVVVNAFHASPFPQSSKMVGIAKLPDRCLHINYRDCDHPSYGTVVEHLFKLQRTPAFVRDLTSFAIDMKIKFKGPLVKKDVSIAFKAMSTGLKIGKDVELYNKVSRWTDDGDFRLYHTGYIDSKKTTSTLGRVEMVVSAPGFKDRTVTLPVRTALSTFVELEMEKN